MVLRKENIHVPVALPTTRGKPIKNTSTRKRAQYELGNHLKNKLFSNRSFSMSLYSS